MFKLSEKSHVKFMHTALLLYLLDFYYVQDAKSAHRNNIGGVMHHYILMMDKIWGTAFWSQNAWSALA